MWLVEYKHIASWLDEQDTETIACIFAALERLEQLGPALGRPLVDTLKGSHIKNLKELRPASPGTTEIRILFAFDPKRNAILLLGGDKSRGRNGKIKWSGWYKDAIPKAEEVYRSHIAELGGCNDQSQ